MARRKKSQTRAVVEISAGLRFAGILLLGVTLGTVLVCLPTLAQVNFGRISGTVTDSSGGVVSGTTVTVTNTETNVTRNLTADSVGAYAAAALIPGTYSVRAEAPGFKAVVHQGVVVQVGIETRVDLRLEVGATAQTVTVTEETPLVDATSATLGGTLTSEAINDLPLNGRNFQNLISLRPGVVIVPGGGPWQQSTNGQHPLATIYYVDGLMDNDYNLGWTVMNTSTPISDAGSVLPIDAIQEFNLEQNPKAEFGWKSGEVVNVGIKSGTDSLHGSAYAFGRDGAWDARNFFNPVPQKIAPVQLENFGGSLGGSIVRNKLFFFGAYEDRRDQIGNSFAMSIPETLSQATSSNPAGDTTNSIPDAEAALSKAGIPISSVSVKLLSIFPANTSSSPIETFGFPNTDQTDNGILKVDYNINAHNVLSGMFFHSVYAGIGEDHPYVSPRFDTSIPMSNWVNNYSWIWTPNSNWVNEARFGFNRLTLNTFTADGGVSATSYGINTGITTPGGLPTIVIGAFNPLGGNIVRPGLFGPDPVYNGLDNVSYEHGNHAFKFGFELSHIAADAGDDVFGRGQISFGGGGAFSGSTPLEDFLSGDAAFPALQGVGNPLRHLAEWVYAGFFQDDWRVTARLTLNLGLRYEYFTPPTERNNLIGSFSPTVGLEQVGMQISTVFQPDRKNFSPRFGMAWDPTGRGKTVIRVGGAVIYDHPGMTTLGAIGSIPTGFLLGSTQGTGTISSGVVASAVGPAQWNGVVFAPSNTPPACLSFAPCNITFDDPNLKYPYIANWNVGVQHRFTSTLALDVEYVGNYGGRIWGIKDINQPVNPSVNPVGPYSAPTQFPYLDHIDEVSDNGWSNYDGLQVTLTQHTSHGLSFLAGYTYSHALDLSSLDVVPNLPQNSLNPSADYASSDFDLRHRFTLTTTYDIPGKKTRLQLLEGWQINSIVTLQTGMPWLVDSSNPVNSLANGTTVINGDISETGELTDRWDFFGTPADFSGPTAIPHCSGAFETPGGVECTSYPFNAPPVTLTAAASEQFRQTCFAAAPDKSSGGTLDSFGCYVKGKSLMVPPALGTFGTMGRNIFRDSGFRDWDLSIFKNFRFGERVTGQFRAEFFNVLNHPNFANPYGAENGNGGLGFWSPLSPGLFGCGCSTPDVAAANPIVGSGDARAIQLGFQLLF